MLRTFDLVLIGAMVAAAIVTYQIKHEAEQLEDRVASLRREIRLEEDTIDLLKADWALLNQPARLQKLVEIHKDALGLQPVKPQQIVSIEELPGLAIKFAPPPSEDQIAKIIDQIVTGSVAEQ